MNKKGLSIATTLFIFLVVFLLFSTLFIFNTKKTNFSLDISQASLANQVYERTFLLEDYLGDIVEKAAKNCDSKEEFESNLINELYYGEIPSNLFEIDEARNIYFPEFSEIVSQVNQGSIVMINNGEYKEFSIEFDLIIKDLFSQKKKPFFLSGEKYEKTFYIEHNLKKSFKGVS